VQFYIDNQLKVIVDIIFGITVIKVNKVIMAILVKIYFIYL